MLLVDTIWLYCDLMYNYIRRKTLRMKQTQSAVPTNPSAASSGRDRREKSEIIDIRRFCFAFWELPSTAHRHRRQLPHLRSQINPGTVLGLTAAFIASLQTAQARKSARKTTKRPKPPPPRTRTSRPKPTQSRAPIFALAVTTQSLCYR